MATPLSITNWPNLSWPGFDPYNYKYNLPNSVRHYSAGQIKENQVDIQELAKERKTQNTNTETKMQKPALYAIETHPNPNMFTIHISIKIQPMRWMETKTTLKAALMNILGIVDITADCYSITITKAVTYTIEELIPQVIDTLKQELHITQLQQITLPHNHITLEWTAQQNEIDEIVRNRNKPITIDEIIENTHKCNPPDSPLRHPEENMNGTTITTIIKQLEQTINQTDQIVDKIQKTYSLITTPKDQPDNQHTKPTPELKSELAHRLNNLNDHLQTNINKINQIIDLNDI